MFLRASNKDEAADRRSREVDERISVLQEAVASLVAPEDARPRLDLAAILAWRGHYRATLDIAQPLTAAEYPFADAMEARQMIGDTHYRHDQYDLAHRQYLENFDLARAAGDPYMVAAARCGLAWVLIDVGHYTSGEFAEAACIFEEHTPLYRELGRHSAEAMGVYGQSRAAAGLGEYDRAIDLSERSISLLERHGDHHLLQLPLLQIANVLRDQGHFGRARPYYDKAVDASDRSQDAYLQVLTAHSYALLLQYEGEADCAQQMWHSVLPTVRSLEFPRLGSEICERLANMAAGRGAYEEAYHRQIEGQEFANRVGILSSVLQNQQLLLRAQIDKSSQLQDALIYLTAGIEASADGIFVIERVNSDIESGDWVIRFANTAAAKMLGKTPDIVNNVLVRSAWKSPTADLLLSPSLEVHASGEHCTRDPVQLEFVQGRAKWYSVQIDKIPNGVVWSISDVTDRFALQQELLAQRDRLEQANVRLTALDREKSEMLGIAAHDLRSPIGNIRSLCELMTTDGTGDRSLLSTIESIADSLMSLIGNLLDVERIERGEMTLNIAPVAVAPLLRDVVAQFGAEARQKLIAVTLDAPTLPSAARADESALRRIVQNLISNALKFSPPDSQVVVRALEVGGRIRIEIQDSGPGISEGDRERLFGKFVRLSARPTAGESSTGLGLSIVKRLVEAMDGSVGCASSLGSGATFWLEIPQAK